jgi:hypothetical protein
MKDKLLALVCACCFFAMGFFTACSDDDMIRKFKSNCEKSCSSCAGCVDEAETGCICE